jgi:quinoprotein glucose dehydrogenase
MIRSGHEDENYGSQLGTPYAMLRRFLQSPSDLPCGAPPWGTLTAVDMAKGTIRWRVPLGSMQDFGGAHGSIPPGSISLGGPITTEGGLVFIAGTTDSRIRGFNVDTGEELWNAALPAAGNATPMTYEVNGKQYLVIAAGGDQVFAEEPPGDAVVAFALP